VIVHLFILPFRTTVYLNLWEQSGGKGCGTVLKRCQKFRGSAVFFPS
jgi:hypothetical protein